MIEYILLLIALGTFLSYIVLGFIFAMETLLALNGVEGAKKWIKKRNSPKKFKNKLVIFLPFLYLEYFLLEILPYHLKMDDEIKPFDMEKVYKFIYKEED